MIRDDIWWHDGRSRATDGHIESPRFVMGLRSTVSLILRLFQIQNRRSGVGIVYQRQIERFILSKPNEVSPNDRARVAVCQEPCNTKSSLNFNLPEKQASQGVGSYLSPDTQTRARGKKSKTQSMRIYKRAKILVYH